MNIRELRLALKEKLEHRRQLMTENKNLRRAVSDEKDRNNFLLKTLGNPLVNMALEDCADKIVNEIMRRAIEASEVIADETLESGDYEIGIDIPSLHIRRLVSRLEAEYYRGSFDDVVKTRTIKRVNYTSR